MEQIISIISSVNPLSNTENHQLCLKVHLYSMGLLMLISWKHQIVSILLHWKYWLGCKTIQILLRNWPMLIMAGGCSVNVLAGTKLTELLSLLSPNVWCSVHVGDGSLKQMAKSQTHSVPEVKEFQSYLRILLHHFQLNG